MGIGKSEEFTEGVHHFRHISGSASHQCKDLAPVTQPTSFGEHYISPGSALHIHARYWFWERPTDVKNLCMGFVRLCGLDDVEIMTLEAIGAMRREAYRHPILKNDDGAVFVDVVEFSENPKGVALWRDAISLVWLTECELCGFFHANKAVEKSLCNPPICQEVSRLLEDEEFQVFNFIPREGCASWSSGKGINHMVQTTPQLVYDITEQDPEPSLLAWFKRTGADSYFVPVRLVMQSDRVRGIYRPCTAEKMGFELLEIVCSSLDLQFDTVEGGHGKNSKDT